MYDSCTFTYLNWVILDYLCEAPGKHFSKHRLWLNNSHKEAMGKMAIEIAAFLVATAGWVLVSSTLPTDYWKVSSNDGTVITTATFWCNLWKMCVTDSTGVSNCKDFTSMLALDGQPALKILCCMSERQSVCLLMNEDCREYFFF